MQRKNPQGIHLEAFTASLDPPRDGLSRFRAGPVRRVLLWNSRSEAQAVICWVRRRRSDRGAGHGSRSFQNDLRPLQKNTETMTEEVLLETGRRMGGPLMMAEAEDSVRSEPEAMGLGSK